MKQLRQLSDWRVSKLIASNAPEANRKQNNNTLITQIVYSFQVLKIVEKFLKLFSTSYFLGVIWFILCDLQLEYHKRYGEHDHEYVNDNFIDKYLLRNEQDSYRVAVIVTYYLATTLTTIGLGDIFPQSNFERIVCTIIMLIGIASISIIFQEIQAAIAVINQIRNPFP